MTQLPPGAAPRRRARAALLFSAAVALGVALTFATAFVLSVLRPPPPAPHQVETAEVVGAVLLPASGVIRRWEAPATVGLVNGTPELADFLVLAARRLNAALDGTGMTFRVVTESEPDIRIVIVARADWETAAPGLTAKVADYARGVNFYNSPKDGWAIAKAIILVDPTFGDAPESIIHELTHVAGIANHNPFDEASVLYSGGPGHMSQALDFSANDRKLLRLLYGYLQPGDGPIAIKQLFDRHWAEL